MPGLCLIRIRVWKERKGGEGDRNGERGRINILPVKEYQTAEKSHSF